MVADTPWSRAVHATADDAENLMVAAKSQGRTGMPRTKTKALLIGGRGSQEAVKLVYKLLMQGTDGTAVPIPGISNWIWALPV